MWYFVSYKTCLNCFERTAIDLELVFGKDLLDGEALLEGKGA